MKLLSEFVYRFRKPIIFSTFIITAVLAYFIKDLSINSDFTSYLPETDKVVTTLNYVSEKFSGKHIAIIAIESDEIFSKETIERINHLTSKFRLIDGVSYVTSLTNIIDIKKVDGGLEIAKLIDEYNLPKDTNELCRLKDYALSKDLYRDRIVSADSKIALIICKLREGSDDVRIAREIKEIVTEANMKEKVYFAGYSFNILEVSKIIIQDLRLLIVLALIVIISVLYLSYRSFSGVILPLISVFMSIVWALGIMSLLKVKITLVTNVIPIVLIAVGSAYCIHMISKFYEEGSKGYDRASQIKISISEVVVPIFLSAITTMVGFISFIFGSYLTVIREFGIFSALGILFAFVISITFVPAILSLLQAKKDNDTAEWSLSKKGGDKFNLFMDMISKWILKNKVLVIVIGIVICVLSIFYVLRVQRNVDMTKYFKSNSEIRIASEMMRNKFGGDMPVYFLVEGDIQDPKTLTEMKKLQEFIKSQKNIYNPQSIVDLIEEMNDVMGEGRTIPDSKDKIGNLWFLIEGDEMVEQLVDPEKREAIIQATMPNFSNPDEMHELGEKIQEFITKNIDTSIVKVEITGMPFINEHMDRAIVESQLMSLVIALVFVLVCMICLHRSIINGLVGIIPIVFTLLAIFGFMGYFEIPLNLATVLVGSISIGIGIDYPIHFTNRFRIELIRTNNELEALSTTLKTTGKAILINVVAVMLGFLVLTMSNLVPLQNFGILIAITMLSSGTATLTLLPSAILLIRDRT